ncbi:MAG: aminotransferase class I/II-fold pyridoxal phosphate-dependent enzyme [Acidipropionibacterium sp.]|jgi:DNA-binding transcriptional MocR family regulator|nr:aminotransferase class I/II-fold pyridoxal phosphate-dependent enzyme [Acidipropionibacterium sp.]
MPVIQRVAERLSVSAGTVAAAWKILAGLGLLESRGRSGTIVLPPPENWLPPRYRAGADPAATVTLNLAEGTPDRSLLPDVSSALRAVSSGDLTLNVDSYLDTPVRPDLEALLREDWPYHAQRITVVNGAMDAVFRTLTVVTHFGDKVAVESPGYPPFFDTLDALGLIPVALDMDSSGVTPESLQHALKAQVRAVLIQPRAQNPTGVSLKTTRVRELCRTIKEFATDLKPVVIEDDHSGPITQTKAVSLGSYLPDSVVHVRSYSKTHGPDMRIAAVGGPATTIDAMVARRLLGPGWTSHLIQMLLAQFLTDPESQAQVSRAAAEYRRRRIALAASLAEHGVRVLPGDGLTMWIPVGDESVAANQLLAAGIRVSMGSQFVLAEKAGNGGATGPGHIRVSLGALHDVNIDDIAAVIARAALAD